MSKVEKKGLVPSLRFPEFLGDGEWEVSPLDMLAKRVTNKNKDESIKRVLTNSAIDGVVDQRDYFDKDIANSNNLGGYFIVDKGDYVYNPRISAAAPVGPISKNNLGKGVMSPLYTVFRFKNTQNGFYEQYFKSSYWHFYLQSVTNSGARHDRISITNDVFDQMPLPKTSPEEQQKIADCLSSIDALITTQSQKIDALNSHKKGLMQQLFPQDGETTPKLRFPEFLDEGEWIEMLLGHEDVSDFVKARVSINDLNIKTYVSTENLLADYSGVSQASKLPPSGSFTEYKKGDVLISNIRPYLKKVWQADKNGTCSNDVVVIRAGVKVSNSFLKVILKNDAFINYVMIGAKGVKMPRGDITQMKEYPVLIPEDKEQQKIADCLSPLDTLITAHDQKLEALKAHKKGLMQQLFPVIDEFTYE